MLCYLNDLINAVDKRQYVHINYLDCVKAFHWVSHQRLYIKLEAMGIGGKVLNWITSFLTDRYHRVNIKKSTSDWLPVMSGVSCYGSVLGPVIFLIYIKDLVNSLESAATLFTDDAKIYNIIKTKEDVETLECDLKQLDNWSDKWLLSFNLDMLDTTISRWSTTWKGQHWTSPHRRRIWVLQCLTT